MADAAILIFDPSLYRKSLGFVHETLGPAWSTLYGLLFAFCAIFVFISVIFSGISLLFIPGGIMMACTGLFFLLSETQRFSHFTYILSSLSDWQYRLAVIIFIILAAVVCFAATIVHLK
jgi:hypothetical protein